MAKVPGPYMPIAELRGDDPPPYFEVDPRPVDLTTAPLPSIPPPTSYVPDNSIRTRGSVISSSPAENTEGVVTRGVPLASKSIDVVCPHCNVEIRTSIEKRPGLLAYLSGAVMACLCCFCGCCLIPCCIEECMEVKHTCPNCDGLIGKYRL